MKYIRSIISILQSSDKPLWQYIPVAVLLSIVPAYLISITIFTFFPNIEQVAQEFGGILGIFSIAVLAPLIESIMMLPLLILLQKLTGNRWIISAIVSALIWAALHSIFNMVWGFQIVWSFFIFSIVMLTWLKKSKMVAVAVTAWVHAIQNLIGVGLLYFGT